jgi:hypothetical protein
MLAFQVLLGLHNTLPNSTRYVMEPTLVPHPFVFLLKLFPPTHLPTYTFKLKVDSSPSTYSLINLNVLLSSPPTYPLPSVYLPTNILGRYLPNPTYMATHTYLVGTPIDLQWSKMMRKE